MEQIARTPKQIGDVIRRERRRSKLTQSALGDRVSLRQEAISKIEGGSLATRIENICDLLAALDMEIVIRPRSKGSAEEIEEIF